MFETVWIAYLVVAVLAAGLLFPSFGSALRRWGAAVFYGSALLAIVGWALLKSFFVLLGRKLPGR